MPHSRLSHPSDWSFALDSIEVAARLQEDGKTAWATELHARELVLGTTADARRDLRIVYVEPKPTLTVVPTGSTDDYRDLMTSQSVSVAVRWFVVSTATN